MAYCDLVFQTEKDLKPMKNPRNFKQVLSFNIEDIYGNIYC